MAVNKCNIVAAVNRKIALIKRGVYCMDDSSIYDNYVDYCNCDIVKGTCYPDNCSNPVVFVPCAISITGMVREVEENEANVFILGNSIVGGTPPYTYHWTFDTTEFDLVGSQDEDTLVITAKEGKNLGVIISPITVTLTDSLNCHVTKTCYISPSGMQCASNYSYCANPIGLTTRNKVTYCPKPLGLIVNKK